MLTIFFKYHESSITTASPTFSIPIPRCHKKFTGGTQQKYLTVGSHPTSYFTIRDASSREKFPKRYGELSIETETNFKIVYCTLHLLLQFLMLCSSPQKMVRQCTLDNRRLQNFGLLKDYILITIIFNKHFTSYTDYTLIATLCLKSFCAGYDTGIGGKLILDL